MPGRRYKVEPGKKVKKGTFTRLLSQVFKHKIRLILVIIGMLGSSMVQVSASLFLKVSIDNYITPMLLQDKDRVDFGPFVHAILIFALILLFGTLCSFMYKLLMVKMSNGILRDIRKEMYAKMQTFPLKFFDTNNAGDIMSRYTNDLDTLRQVISQALPQAITGLVTILTVFASMLMLSINLFVVVVFMVMVMILVTKWIGNRSLK